MNFKLLFISMVSLFITSAAISQTTITTIPPLIANNGSTAVTFQMETSLPILVTGVSNTFNTGTINAEIWYRVGGVLHAGAATPTVSTANGWVQAGTASISVATNTAPTAIPIANMSIPVNPGTPVGFAVTGGTRYMTFVAGNAIDFTAGGATVKTGPGFGFGGSFPNPTIITRQFLGSVTFSPAGPCVNPPFVGNATSTKSITCSGENFVLGLDSLTAGLGQTYQWQRSTDSLTWTNMVGDTVLSVTTSQTTTHWYRVNVTCGTGTPVTSAPVKVTTTSVALPGGTYTINGNLPTGGTNFATFVAFQQAIACGGISGAVTVNVISKGSAYNEQFILPNVGGTSATNTITINGNGQTITFGGGANWGTMVFEGTQYVHVKKLNIVSTGTANGAAVQFRNDARYLEFDSCEFKVSVTATSTLINPIVASGSTTSALTAGLNVRDLTIKNSLIEGGYYGLTLMGPTAAPWSSNNVIENNIIKDFYFYGIYTTNQENSTFEGNDINRATRTGLITTFYGIFCGNNMAGVKIIRNKIHSPATTNTLSTGTAYPIFLSVANATALNPMLVANNAIYNINMNGLTYAIYLASGNFINFYHNTVSIDNTQATTTSVQRVFLSFATTGTFEVKNNIFNINHGGTGIKNNIYLSSTVPTWIIDNNQYNFAGNGSNNVGYWSGANVSTFAAWQGVNSGAFDQNGVFGDPIFSTTDPIVPQTSIGNAAGANLLSVVPTDIYGVARDTTPDIGAVEYTPLTCLQPLGFSGTSTSTSITINWTNDPDADSVHIEYGPCGFNQGTGTMVNTTATTFTATGLFPETCYTFYVYTWCNGVAGNGVSTINVTTLCAAKSTPLFESFDNGPVGTTAIPNPPACWSYYKSPTHTGYGYVINSFPPIKSTPNHWRYYSGGTLNDTLALISPAIQGITNGDKRVRFWAATHSATVNQRVIIGTVASPLQMNTLQIIDTVLATQLYQEFTVFLDAGNGYNGTHEYVVFMQGAFLTFQSLYLDDIIIDNIPSCNPPTTINANNITSSSASIAWTTISGTCFKLEYGPQGFTQGTGTGTVIQNATTPTTISGLSPNTFYDVYIADCCDTNAWAGPFTFKTNCLVTLNGTYTIGGPAGPTNFATLDSAINVLTGCGVSGPVTFNLAPGTYTRTWDMGPITGASATNTITFNGVSASLDTIRMPAGGTSWTFSGAAHITFKNITFNGHSAGRAIWLRDNANNLTFEDCNIIGDTSSTLVNTGAIHATSSATSPTSVGNNANNITVKGCKLYGGYYCVTMYGTSTTSYSSGFVLEDNEFLQVYAYGAFVYYVENISAQRNIMLNSRTTFGYGYYGFHNKNYQINRNIFIVPTYGIYMSNGNNFGTAPATPSEINNNMAVGNVNTGIWLVTVNNTNVYHNSTRGSTYGMYMSGYNNPNIRNNIFVGGTALYSVTAQASATVDYNIYHGTGANTAFWGVAYATLAAWKTASPLLNLNSLQGNPGYAGPNDLTIIGTLPNDVGLNGLATVDVFGNPRPAPGSTTVDIGAHEFTPKQWDAVNEGVLVDLAGCGDSSTTVAVIVRNLGLNTITSLPVTVNVTGGVTANLNTTATVSIASGVTDTIAVGTINTYAGASGVNFLAIVNLATDQDNTNDTATAGPASYIPYEPTAFMPDTVCAGADSALFRAVPVTGATMGWFANPTDTVAVVEGDSAMLNISNQLTWYLGYVGSGSQTLVTAYAGGNGCGGGVMFNITANKNLTVTGFEVSANDAIGAASPLNVYFIANGTYLGNELNASAWTLHGASSATSAGVGNPTIHTMPTALIIPAGATFAIYLNYNSSYTNGNGANQVVSNADMTVNLGIGMCGLFTGPNNPRVFNGGIIYGGAACSQIKVPVTVPTIGIAASAQFTATVQGNGATVDFNAAGSTGTTYDWYFGDGNDALNAGAVVQHTYANAGTYNALLVMSETDCGTTDSLFQSVLVTVGLEETLLGQSLSIFPNPNTGNFRVSFMVEGVKKANINVVNPMGQIIYTHTPGNISGEFKHDIDLSRMAAGVYIVQITTDDGIISRRVTVQK